MVLTRRSRTGLTYAVALGALLGAGSSVLPTAAGASVSAGVSVQARVGAKVSASASACPAATGPTVTPDFDGDDAAGPDLAIGIPGEGLGTQAGAGAVEVRYHSGRTQILHAADYRSGERFGTTAVAANVDRDRCTDLLVGVPGRTVAGHPRAGAIDVYRGTPTGLRFWRTFVQGSAGVPGTPQTDAGFGSAIGYDAHPGSSDDPPPPAEFWIGVPGLDVGSARDAGGVVDLTVDASGSTPRVDGKVLTMGSGGVPGHAQPGARLGSAVAGTTGGPIGAQTTGFAAGAPGASVSGLAGAGAVLFRDDEPQNHRREGAGSSTTAQPPAYALLTQDTPAIQGAPEAGDGFGSALVFTAEGSLIIGVPGEDVGTVPDAGMVDSWYFASLESGAARWWNGRGITQSGKDVVGVAEAGDRFGAALASWELSPEGEEIRNSEVAVGVPGEDLGTVQDAGMVDVLDFADPRGGQPITAAGGFSETQTAGAVEAADRFGASLAATSYAGVGSSARWLVGVPGKASGSGAVVFATPSDNRSKISASSLLRQVTGTPEPGDGYGSAIASASGG